jgi:ABC-type long-subunit fatty acid transport system fused permease/ATPase subunit
MNNITAEYITRAEIWVFITILIYFLMNGAQIFETVVIVPKWTAAPPESLQIFKGKHALDFKSFWITMHSIHEVTFILAIAFCWQIDTIRNWVLILFAVHFAVRVWTLVYFAPNIIEFQKIANSGSNEISLLNKASKWKNLNYLRVATFIVVSLGLILLFIRLLSIR